MVKPKAIKDLNRAVKPKEAQGVRGGAGKAKTPPKTPPKDPNYLEFKIIDVQISS
ncbi:MAG: hypothetical protein ABI765_16560 [Gemmatimonadota bacterium]